MGRTPEEDPGHGPGERMRLHVAGSFPGGGPPETWGTPRLLASVSRQIEREVDAGLAPLRLSHASLPVLALLVPGPSSQRELAHALHLTEQAVSRMVARLESRGLVAREVDPAHRRRRLVRLTDAGRAALTTAADPRRASAALDDRLTAQERANLRRILLKLLRPEAG